MNILERPAEIRFANELKRKHSEWESTDAKEK